MTTDQSNKLDAIYNVLGRAEVNSFELLTVTSNAYKQSTINMNGYNRCIILDYMSQWKYNDKISSGKVKFKNTLSATASGTSAGTITLIIVEEITDTNLIIYRTGSGTGSSHSPICYGF